jgi:hypothetical protein
MGLKIVRSLCGADRTSFTRDWRNHIAILLPCTMASEMSPTEVHAFCASHYLSYCFLAVYSDIIDLLGTRD